MKKITSDSSVGYGRPPTQYQFRPGQSGNPSGRPKNARSLRFDLLEELGKLITFTDGDENVEVTKQLAIIKTLVRKAVAGDARAIATVLTLSAATSAENADDEAEAPEDQAIIRAAATYAPKRRNSDSDNPAPRKNGDRSNSDKDGAR